MGKKAYGVSAGAAEIHCSAAIVMNNAQEIETRRKLFILRSNSI
jgi:hypothetical protein